MSVANNDKQKTVAYARSLLQSSSLVTNFEKKVELGIAEIRNLMGEFIQNESAGRLSPALASAHEILIKKGIDEQLAGSIVQDMVLEQGATPEMVRQQVTQILLKRLPDAMPPPSRDAFDPIVIALVGPTGVGKTTTIAKLATKFRLQQGRSVSLITADTYRVAAVDQLRQYAELFDSNLEIAGTAEQMSIAMAACIHSDIILVDTAGRSASDGDRIDETAKILSVAKPTETHLVLSAATSETATRRAAEGFAITKYDRVIVSKIDEAVHLGEMISTLCRINTPMSWITNGQDISGNIDLARPSKLVDAFWG